MYGLTHTATKESITMKHIIEVGSEAWSFLYERAITDDTQNSVALNFVNADDVEISIDGMTPTEPLSSMAL